MTQINASWKAVLSATLLSALSGPPLSQSVTANADTHKVQISIEQSYVKIALTIDLKLDPLIELPLGATIFGGERPKSDEEHW